ncbi:FecR domain-containing protein [Phenylobacterium sp.]|uniref:FecR domain-containing protein n=1 Tax=Phenylobacterium sp. TaxID=1871053 RepID=UPI00272EEC14|nr:FecR domain-containing protein [Phenylobacterium sp.]MDP2214710.1 FecR domain-containing protein [Phenylobacterium sp.]
MKRALAALTGTALLLGAGAAAAAEWRLTEVTGRVRVAAPGEDPKAGAPNLTIPPGADITTAGGARAVLSNGDKRIVIGPNSRMTVAAGEPAGLTRIMQDLGSIVFQVDKQAKPHFRVDTPLLAAVVKGTTFTVSVGAVSDTVHVAEGLVEVRANGGGQPNDIASGVTGRVTREAPDQVGVITPAAVATAEPSGQTLPALDYSQVSEGVVMGPAASPARDMSPTPTAGLGPDGSAVEASNGVNTAVTLANASLAAMAQSVAQSASLSAPGAPAIHPGSDDGVPAGPGANNGNGGGPPANVPAGPGANNGNVGIPPVGVPAGPDANNGNGGGPPANVPAGPGANIGDSGGPPVSIPAGPDANNGNGGGPLANVPAGPGANTGNGGGQGRQP